MNTNEDVWVQLTPDGERVLKEHYFRDPSALDALRQWRFENGWWKFCLWEVMHVFGPHSYNGAPFVCFVDNCIQLTKPEH